MKLKIKKLSEPSAVPKLKIKKLANPETGTAPAPAAAPLKLKINLNKPTPAASAQPKQPRIRIKPVRLPGEGYDSEGDDIEDDPLIEEGVVLRLLNDAQLEHAKHAVESGDFSQISIKWKDERHAVVKISGVLYGALLVDLPTISEVSKSVNKKDIFKTIDVSQMLLVVSKITREEEVFGLKCDTENLISKSFEDFTQGTQGFDHKHGITAPLHNVRNRRFRPRMTASEIDYIEAQVEELLAGDGMAEDFNYDLVDEDEIHESIPAATLPVAAAPAPAEIDEDDLEMELENLLGETSKNDSDDLFGDSDEGDVVEQDNGEDDEDDDEDEDEYDNDKDGKDETAKQCELLKDEVTELQATIDQHRDKLKKASNPLIVGRIKDTMGKLEKELEIKKRLLKISEDHMKGADDDDDDQRPQDVEEEEEEEEPAEEEDDQQEDEQGDYDMMGDEFETLTGSKERDEEFMMLM